MGVADGSDHNAFGLEEEEEGVAGARKGYARSFKLPEKEPVLMGMGELYSNRPLVMEDICLDECASAFMIEKKPGASSARGRPRNGDHDFAAGCDLFGHYVLKERSKFVTTVFSGATPPRPPPAMAENERDQAWEGLARAHAEYMVTLFVPMPRRALFDDRAAGHGALQVPSTTIEWALNWRCWSDWCALLHDQAAVVLSDCAALDEDGLAQARLARDLAAARLFRIENVVRCLRVPELQKNMIQAWRGCHRDLWSVVGKPTAGVIQEGVADGRGKRGGDEEAARVLGQLKDRSLALKPDKVLSRCKRASKVGAWLEGFVGVVRRATDAAVEHMAAVARRARVGPRVAAVALRIAGGVEGLKGVSKAFKQTGAGAELAEDDEEAAQLLGGGREGDGDGDDDDAGCDLPPEFAPCARPGEQEEQVEAWRAVGKVGPPPLNDEQRAFSALAFGAISCLARERVRHVQRSGAAGSVVVRAVAARGPAYRAMRARGYDGTHVLIGPAGAGKSACLKAMEKIMTERGLGAMRGSGFTGVSAAPYRTPTLCTLLGISRQASNSSEFAVLKGSGLAAARIAVEAFLRCRLRDLLCLVLDEVSFLRATMIGQINRRLQVLLECDEPFGGLVLIFAGDFFQLPPPMGTPLYKQLIAQARGELEDLPALGTEVEGLKVFAAARRSLLKKMVRAEDPELVEILTKMRDVKSEMRAVFKELVSRLKCLDEADCMSDSAWVTIAPTVVLSHAEQNALELVRARAFSRATDRPLITWPLRLARVQVCRLLHFSLSLSLPLSLSLQRTQHRS